MLRRASPLLAAVILLLTGCGLRGTVQVMDLQSSGSMDRSATFSALGAWQLVYSYDCTSSSATAGFVVQVINSSDDTLLAEGPDIVDAKAAHGVRGASETIDYKNGGSFYLQVQSGCAWRIVVRESE